MELHHDDRVFFDPISHSYLLDGDVLLMGVTELMRKHNLGADYGNIPASILKKAAEEGTAIHKEIEDYDSGEAIFASELIDEYRDICLANGLKSVESEYPITDYETIASAIDKVYENRNGKAVLVDIKTTLDFHRRALQWQLGIYKVFFERLNPDKEVEGCFCLWIDKKTRKIKGLIPIEPVSAEEVAALIEAERNGLIYIDENDIPDASLVLKEDELATYISKANEIAALKAKIKEIEAGLKFYDEQMLAYMADNNLDEMAAPGGVFKRKKSYTQTRVDSAKLQKLYPAVFEKVTKQVEVAASLSFKPTE